MFNKKNFMSALISFLILGTFMYFQSAVKAEGTVESWQSNGTSWSYIDLYGNKTTGWLRWQGNYYYMDSNGIMVEGWKSINGKWYHFKPGSGIMTTGWLYYKGSWYFLDRNNGAMATGIIKDGTKTYWLNPGGDMATGWKGMTYAWYYFSPSSGERVTGWLYNGGSWYYIRPLTGEMAKGWVKSGYNWYYMQDSGAMARNTTINNYYLSSSGAWQPKATRWYSKDGQWYYLNPFARNYEKGWVIDSIEGFETGWISDNGKWYYMNPVTREMVTGWVFDGANWYYMNKDGSMASNTTIDGYKLGSNGAWITDGTAEDYLITIGSSEEDVSSVMLDPTVVETSAPLVKYYYNRSVIYLLDDNGKKVVIGWDNSDNNLKISTGPITGTSFTLGSTMADVAKAMGTPKIFDPYYYIAEGRETYWEYGDGSRVNFDGSFKVNGWSNVGSLKVNAGNKDAAAPSIKLGTTLEDVVKVLGTPTKLSSNSNSKLPYHVYYGDTYLNFGYDGKVAGWKTKDIYDIRLGTKDPSAAPIKIGSTLEDAVNAMGTPDELGAYYDGKPQYLKYGTSYVDLNYTTGLVEKWVNNGNLKVTE